MGKKSHRRNSTAAYRKRAAVQLQAEQEATPSSQLPQPQPEQEAQQQAQQVKQQAQQVKQQVQQVEQQVQQVEQKVQQVQQGMLKLPNTQHNNHLCSLTKCFHECSVLSFPRSSHLLAKRLH